MTHTPPPSAEQALYRGLLNGNMLSELKYANGLATFYAGKFTDRAYFDQHRDQAFDQLFNAYRNVLNEAEEDELADLMQGTNIPRLIRRMYALEAIYMVDFSELAQEKTGRIATVQTEIRERLQFSLPNPAIDALDTVLDETQALYEQKKEQAVIQRSDALEKHLAGIRQDWGQSESYLMNDLQPKFIIHVERNSGDRDEALDTWAKSMAEFRNKLQLTPNPSVSETGRKQKGTYYRWFENGATVQTFVYRICVSRWLDVLKSPQRLTGEIGQEGIIALGDSEPGGSQPMPALDLIDFKNLEKLRDAIDALDPFCRELIQLHYFEGYSLPEIAEKLPDIDADGSKRFYSYRTIVVKHNQCIEKLKRSLYS
ncbi:MAG: hypothetical protein H7Z72_21940 [Bacteroidetes bacterium]|nr:hypothetical protein [Fibrella sp.]